MVRKSEIQRPCMLRRGLKGSALILLLAVSSLPLIQQSVNAQHQPEEWMSETLGRVETRDACIARAEEVAKTMKLEYDGHWDRDDDSIEMYDITDDNFDFVIRCEPWDHGDPAGEYVGELTGKNEADKRTTLRDLLEQIQRAWDRLGYVG